MILLDPLRSYAHTKRLTTSAKPQLWSHMVSDESLEELHAFAERIGMRRAWFQGDHYDLMERMHVKARACGAVLVPSRELARRRVRE